MKTRPSTIKVHNVLQLLQANLKSDDPELAKHAATLVGPRLRGSTTKWGLERLAPLTECKEGLPEDGHPGCDYLFFEAERLEGKIGAVRDDDPNLKGRTISEREGTHGPERFLDVSPEDASLPTAAGICVILGTHKWVEKLLDANGIETGVEIKREERAVFTWHPGPPIDPPRCIRLHNGQ